MTPEIPTFEEVLKAQVAVDKLTAEAAALAAEERAATCAVPSRHSEIHPDDRGFFPHLNGAT